MLKIGTFSKLSRLSIRMLRRYDELGLLQPVHTDPFTGYRYYREEQLTTAGRIAALRDMGFGLSAIGALLEDGGREELDRRLAEQQRALEALLAETRPVSYTHLDVYKRQVSQRNAGKETYTGQRVLAAVPPPGKTGSSGKEGRVVIPPFPVLEPFPQQRQQQLRF